jgi:hypothetical protein
VNKSLAVLLCGAISSLAAPVSATPYQSFTDVRTRATVGTTVIRNFPASSPSFRLLLERKPSTKCIVWLEFLSRARPIDHVGLYGVLPGESRRELVEGPLDNDNDLDEQERNIARSFLADLDWVARGTNDALHLVSADVGHDANGACVSGTSVRFTPNLAYRDVKDVRHLEEFGEERLRGFPGATPTFTLIATFADAGEEVPIHTGRFVTLEAPACILYVEFADVAFPIYSPSAFIETFENRVDIVASTFGGEDATVGNGVPFREITLPWYSLATGEVIRLLEARAELLGGPNSGTSDPLTCRVEARTQFGTSLSQFYR